MTTTIKLFGGDLGGETMLVRCNLTEASAPVEVDYCEGSGWQGCQYQCADTRHRTGGLADIGKILAARAVEMTVDEFDCEADEINVDLIAMAEMLERHGDRFAGNDVDETAQEWLDHDFTAEIADPWCEIGTWDASTAAEFRDAGLTPTQVKDAAEAMTADLEDPAEEYTDGCPIYAACNNDIIADEIIEAAKDAIANN